MVMMMCMSYCQSSRFDLSFQNKNSVLKDDKDTSGLLRSARSKVRDDVINSVICGSMRRVLRGGLHLLFAH